MMLAMMETDVQNDSLRLFVPFQRIEGLEMIEKGLNDWKGLEKRIEGKKID